MSFDEEYRYERCIANGGNYQYRVICPESIADQGDIYLFAEKAHVEGGALSFFHRDGYLITTFAAGSWTACHICSAIDASPTNIYRWDAPAKRGKK